MSRAAAAAAAADWLPLLAPEVGPRGPVDPSPGNNPPSNGYLSFFINVLVFRLGLENQQRQKFRTNFSNMKKYFF